jgi:hypothetical protein
LLAIGQLTTRIQAFGRSVTLAIYSPMACNAGLGTIRTCPAGEALMGDLGKVHPILTTALRAERATLRAARELARLKAEKDPENLDLDPSLVLTPQALARMIGCHRASYQKLDWRPLAELEPVALPVRTRERERAARHALATWQPGWFDRVFVNEAVRRRELNNKVMEAAREDEIAFQKDYRAASLHNAEVLAAHGLLQLDPRAIKDTVAAKTRLADLGESVNRFGVALPADRRVIALVEAIQEVDIPYVRVVAGGRQELIPPAERRRIHLTAICSAALRIGADLVAVLPVDAVEVVVACETADGAGSSQAPVLQMLVTAASLVEQPWGKTDAVNLARALRARLDWSPAVGFSPIELRDLRPAPLAPA